MKLKRISSVFLVILITFSFSMDAFATRHLRLGNSTISQIAEHFRSEYGMSTHALTQDILDFNGISWEGARHLGPDTMIKLPPTKGEYDEAARQLERQKNAEIARIRDQINCQKNEVMSQIAAQIQNSKSNVLQKIKSNIYQQKTTAIIQNRIEVETYEKEIFQKIKQQESEIEK